MEHNNSESKLLIADDEFRNEVIYFIVVDRFYDGNPRNTGTRSDLNDPHRKDWNKYWGGDLETPDGIHQCILTGNRISVVDGTLQEVVVENGAIWAFSVRGQTIQAPVIVNYQTNSVPTRPGEWLTATGSCPELGGWDVTKAIRLECINCNLWFGELPFVESCGQSVAYKLVIISETPDQAPRREGRPGRLRGIIKSGVTKCRDIWEE